MAGIFPESGVAANLALNSVDVDTTNCDSGELFHSTARCQPRFDPAAANAVMSEILNAVTCAGGLEYDCNRLNNLCLGMTAHFNETIQNGCYELDDIGDNCDSPVKNIGFLPASANGTGCGRIVTLEQETLPRGLKVYTESVLGRFIVETEVSPTSQRIRDNSGAGAEFQYYEALPDNVVTLSAIEFCGLQVAGTRLELESLTTIGYQMNANANGPGTCPYQWGVAIFVDGAFVKRTGDDFCTNVSGHNSGLTDVQRFVITTTGADITIEIVPYLVAETTNGSYTAGDTFETDMAQIAVRYDAF